MVVCRAARMGLRMAVGGPCDDEAGHGSDGSAGPIGRLEWNGRGCVSETVFPADVLCVGPNGSLVGLDVDCGGGVFLLSA